jgi:hypothetical protein
MTGQLKFVIGVKSFFTDGTGFQVFVLGTYKGGAFTRFHVLKIHHHTGFAIFLEGFALSKITCINHVIPSASCYFLI